MSKIDTIISQIKTQTADFRIAVIDILIEYSDYIQNRLTQSFNITFL